MIMGRKVPATVESEISEHFELMWNLGPNFFGNLKAEYYVQWEIWYQPILELVLTTKMSLWIENALIE